MADFDCYVVEKTGSGDIFFETDGFHRDTSSNDFNPFVVVKGPSPFYEYDNTIRNGNAIAPRGMDIFVVYKNQAPQHRPFFEYDDESECTCEGTLPIHTTGISVAPNEVTVHFDHSVVLSGPALDPSQWVVTKQTTGARDVSIESITVSGSDVILSTTAMTDAAHYTLVLPNFGITDTSFAPFTGLFSLPFIGVPTVVSVQMVKTIDARTIDVIFGAPVNPTDASDPLNYSINNGLEVTAATRITDLWYRLTTTRQVNDVVYTLTATNIGPL